MESAPLRPKQFGEAGARERETIKKRRAFSDPRGGVSRFRRVIPAMRRDYYFTARITAGAVSGSTSLQSSNVPSRSRQRDSDRSARHRMLLFTDQL